MVHKVSPFEQPLWASILKREVWSQPVEWHPIPLYEFCGKWAAQPFRLGVGPSENLSITTYRQMSENSPNQKEGAGSTGSWFSSHFVLQDVCQKCLIIEH